MKAPIPSTFPTHIAIDSLVHRRSNLRTFEDEGAEFKTVGVGGME